MEQLQHLLNKVNKVTAYHRHGNKIPKSALDELSNAQIEYEKSFPVDKPVKVNFAEIEKELNNYAEEINGRIIDNADACDHLQSKLNYINDNFYLIRK